MGLGDGSRLRWEVDGGVREMEMGSLGFASRSGRGSAYGFFLDGLGCFKIFEG